MEQLYKFLKSSYRGDQVALSYAENEESNSWNLEAQQDGLTIRIVINYLNIPEEELPANKGLEWTNTFAVDTSK